MHTNELDTNQYIEADEAIELAADWIQVAAIKSKNHVLIANIATGRFTDDTKAFIKECLRYLPVAQRILNQFPFFRPIFLHYLQELLVFDLIINRIKGSDNV